MKQFDAPMLAVEYRLARNRITSLLEAIDDNEASLPVPTCPAWNVHDLAAHLSGIATEIARGNSPGVDSQKWVDAINENRKDTPLAGLLEEWDSYGPLFEEMAAETRRLAVPLAYDVVVHEHDLRHALGRPGARDVSGVLSAMEVGQWLMTNDLDRTAFGRVVLRAGDRTWVCGTGDERLSLDLDGVDTVSHPVWELLRLTGSRRSLNQARKLPWNGNFEKGFRAMLHMDPPVADIEE